MPAPEVGVKRSREQTDQPALPTIEVRPALDADPAELTRRPTMEDEGRGSPSTSTNSTSPESPTAAPPSLLRAPHPS
jgi:hypothetical protein